MKKKVVIGVIILIGILIISLSTYLAISNNILKLVDNEVVVKLNECYQEPGFNAKVFGVNLTKKVTTNEEIDTTKVGEYHIDYNFDFLFIHEKKERVVKVIDTVEPTIELKGEDLAIVCPNKTYEEEGYTALDNYDGDISDKVIKEELEDKVIYKVMDSSGNTCEVSRNLKREDKECPTIKLNGKAKMYVYLGNAYKEPGYEVTDNCDENLNESVEIIGSVDTNKIGSYTITYKVKDSSGNESSVKRTVKVIERVIVPDNPGVGTGIIYLTFDDGPSLDITPKILDILKEENVKATFFVTSLNAGTDGIIKRAFDEGHTIAVHTSSHVYNQVYASEEAYFADLEAIRTRVRNITGKDTYYIRFPGGSSNTVSRFNPGIMSRLSVLVTERGYKYYDWNVSSGDAEGAPTSTKVYNRVTSNLKYSRGNVVLMHDRRGNKATLNALQNIIRFGKNNGYTFKGIDDSAPTAHHSIAN